jgi:hypothetical protein
VLRASNDNTKTAFYLNGYCAHGHRHADTLGIIYHAYDKELASDRGYIWDDPRNAWTLSTLAHNLVTVDGTNQNAKDRHSRLELFGVAPGVEVMQASAQAYSQCSEYRRTCALVRLPEGGNYVVDVFQVAGGKLHQYCLNANGKFLGLEGAELAPIEGKLSWLTNLRAGAAPPSSWKATWEYEGVKLRLLMDGPLQRLLVTDAPGWRTYKGSELNAPPITQVLAERSGTDTLRSVFTAVLAPFTSDAPAIRGIRRIAADPPGEGAVGVAVELADRVEYILCSPDDQPRTFGPVRLTGRFGFAAVDKTGQLRRAYLLEGTELSCGEYRVTLQSARVVRRVVKATGTEVELDEGLPEGTRCEGAYLLSGGTGFEIESVEGKTLRVRDFAFVGGEQIAIPSAAWLEEKGNAGQGH